MSNDLEEIRSLDFTQMETRDSDARHRASRRLVNDRKPSAASSSSSWVDWNMESEVLGRPWDVTRIPLEKLELMRRDPILAFALMFVKTPLVRAPWFIKSADPKIAAAVDSSLRKIYGRFVLAYCNSLDYGFSPMVKRFEYEQNPEWVFFPKDDSTAEEQQVWTNKTVKPLVWKPFTALNPRRCAPHWNSKGEFNGIDYHGRGGMSPFYQSGYPVTMPQLEFNSGNRIADVPLDWALWATNEKDSVFGSYWGYPRIGYAYRFWWAYWYRFGVADRAFEKWGDPPVIVYHPDDPAAVDTNGERIDYTTVALALAESLRGGANVALPSSVITSMDEKISGMREWQMEQMQSKIDFGSIGDTFKYLDIQKLRSVMVPEQALVEGEGGTSSRNVASTFGDLFQESMAVVKQEIDDHLNRWVIPQFIEINFGSEASRAEIVTTGFDQMDMESMRAVLQLIGQRKLLSVVDERELAERMGVPTVSRKEMNKRLQEAALEAEAMQPTPRDAQIGADEASGVTKKGLYYAPRERIVLGERTSLPYVIERVDELPTEDVHAYFDTDKRTLFVKEGADPDKVRGYLLGLAEKIESEETAIPEDVDLVLGELRTQAAKIDEFLARDTKVQVELQSPEQDDTDYVSHKEVERDEEGFIKKVHEWKTKRTEDE